MRRITVSGNQHTDLAERRFTKKNPCPICGGGHDTERGIGERCTGFLSEDERYAYCTRKGGGLELNENMEPAAYAHRLDGDCDCGLPHGAHLNGHGPGQTSGATSRDGRSRATKARGRIVATYDYVDEESNLLYQNVRFDPKDFRPRHKANGKWAWNLKSVRRVPYHLPELIAAHGEEIWVVDGEKDADRLRAGGVTATSMKPWDAAYAEYFRDADVIVIRDKDTGAGKEQTHEVAQALTGVAASVSVVEALTGTDVSDHLDAGHSLDDLVEVDLDQVLPPRFEFQNLAQIMREGFKPPEMLIPEWLAKGQTTWLQGEPGEGKTWIALYLMAKALMMGQRVLFADEEMGAEVIAQRLLALGVPADTAEERFDYLPFPGLAKTDREEWSLLCEDCQWDFAVFDSGADFFASADVDENSGIQITWWVKTFLDPVRYYGGTPLVLDHLAKKGKSDGYAVGSRAKKAKAKLVWEVTQVEAFSPDTTGRIIVSKEKDNLGTRSPEDHVLDVGGTGDGLFSITVVRPDEVQSPDQAKEKKRQAWIAEAIHVLKQNDALTYETGLTQTQLTKQLSEGDASLKNRAVQHAATSPQYPVKSRARRQGMSFWLDEKKGGKN